MRTARQLMAVLAMTTAAQTAFAAHGDGLVARVDEADWARWQSRLTLGTTMPRWQASLGEWMPAGLKVGSVGVLGDYYFARPIFGSTLVGGFRTTGGIVRGPRSPYALGLGHAAAGNGMGIEHRTLNGSGSVPGDYGNDLATLPYLGVGYTGASVRSGWSFNADVGLIALTPGHAVKFGRVVQGGQPLDEFVRDLRLAPVLQLGVSYSF